MNKEKKAKKRKMENIKFVTVKVKILLQIGVIDKIYLLFVLILVFF